MSDYLRRKIEETRALLEAKQQDVAVLRGQLQAYQDALEHDAIASRRAAQGAGTQLIESGAEPHTTSESPPNAYWPAMIADLSRRSDRFTINDVVAELLRLRKKLTRKSVRARLTQYVKEGALVRLGDGVFRATPVRPNGDELRARGIIRRRRG